MTTTEIQKTIYAPKEKVFETISNIDNFSKAVPHIKEIIYITEQTKGVGTKFSETRVMKGREATTVLEVTDYLENEHIRMLSDSGGTIWDSLFTVESIEDNKTSLTLLMTAKPYKFMSKIITPLIKSMVAKAIHSDMEAIKEYCEKQAKA
jgi:carbon monoxide dehydrogenase subunit G